MLQQHIPLQTESILEIGSGTGRILHQLESRAKRIVGIDHAKEMLRSARRRVSDKVELIEAEAQSIPLPDFSFDYVLCLFNTFGNFEGDQNDYIQEMRRLLKTDGEIHLSVYSERARDSQVQLYHNIGLHPQAYSDRVEVKEGFTSRRFGENQLRKFFTDNNLEVRVHKLTPISYYAIGKKLGPS